MKLAAIIVTYYPEADLVRNIKSFIGDVELLIIWENTPLKDRLKYKAVLLSYSDKIVYLGTDYNEGLGFAYNEGVKYVKNLGYSHLMTMDQDSYFIEFEGYKRNIEKETDITVGLQVPGFNQDGVYEWVPFESKSALQSGCVYSVKMLDKIGLFRVDFFIDKIDIEIVFRARKYGYKCMCYGGCNLIHTIGSCRLAKIGRFQFSPPDYSPLRRFYQVRNTLFVMKEYPNEYSYKDKIKFIKYSIKAIIKIILAETDKFEKITAMLKGFYYGIFSINKPYK